jgi:Domain of unknown function (DUF397)
MINLADAVWRKSVRSAGETNCVEVAVNLADVVAVRDSKDRAGGVLLFTRPSWDGFLANIKAGHEEM